MRFSGSSSSSCSSVRLEDAEGLRALALTEDLQKLLDGAPLLRQALDSDETTWEEVHSASGAETGVKRGTRFSGLSCFVKYDHIICGF